MSFHRIDPKSFVALTTTSVYWQSCARNKSSHDRKDEPSSDALNTMCIEDLDFEGTINIDPLIESKGDG
jgi:hypothetical protein